MFTEEIYIYALGSLLCSFLISAYLVPTVKDVGHSKRLMDTPNNRSSHTKSTASLGGIAFFITFLFSFCITDQFDTSNISISILPGVTILFFMGLKDDLVGLGSKIKFIGQIIACLILLNHTSFEILNFHGFFGVFNMPVWVNTPLSLLIMIAIINAYNLIDGIDGLAASISTLGLTCFAICFFWTGDYLLALTAVTMIGALLGFLLFNLSESNKIFMGDTGSLVIGFLIALMSIRLLAFDHELNMFPFHNRYIPTLMVIIILIPIYDVVRVFTIRILQKRNPFSADRLHVHHIMIDKLQWSHRRTAFAISCLNFLIITCSFVFILGDLGLIPLLIFLSIIIFFITLTLNKWSAEIELKKDAKT